MSAAQDDTYQAYLLRFWRDDARSPWRIVLIDAHTGRQYGFPSPADLHAFLDGQLAGKVEEGRGERIRRCGSDHSGHNS